MSDPNSQNQLWSKWTIVVRPHLPLAPTFATVKGNVARFVRKGFGTGGMMRIRQFPKAWVVEVLVDAQRHPDDKKTFEYFGRSFDEFFKNGFGPNTQVTTKARLMAGQRLDGKAPDQMLILPRLVIPGWSGRL